MATKAKKPSPEGADDGTAAPAGKSRRKLLLGLGAAVLIGGGAGAYTLLWSGKPKANASEPGKKAVVMVNVREMTVNLAAEPNADRPRFLKFSVALEVDDAKVASEIQPLLPRVEDAFQVLVRQLRAADLDGSAGLYRLREELLRRVNVAVHPARVDAVLFKDLVVQ